MEDNKLFELADLLRELKDVKADLEERLKGVNGEIESVQGEMIQMMTDADCAGFNRDGATFSLVITERPGPAEDKKAELYEVMKERGYEGLFTINSKTLSGTIKELKAVNDDQLPEWLDGLIAFNEKAVVRITKGRKANG